MLFCNCEAAAAHCARARCKTHCAPAPAAIPLETKMLEFSENSSPDTKRFALAPQPATMARAFVFCV
jgi:hypothetical protein